MRTFRNLVFACLFCGLPLVAQPKVSPADLGPSGTESVLFKISSDLGVRNQPSEKTFFTLATPARIAKLCTYHWNNGRGKPGGTLALKASNGTTYGPWPVGTIQTASGAPVYWIAKPEVVLPSGTYEVLDSDPATWATNAEMRNMGCAWAIGTPAPVAEKQAGTAAPRMTAVEKVQSFRLQAIPDPIAALKKFASPQALKELSAIEDILFTETPPNVGWSYFFATSTYSVQPSAEGTSVALFYHPWSDTALLTSWKTQGTTFTMDHAELLLGDCLRHEPPFELQPQWEFEARTITPLLSLPIAVGDTLAAFERLFAAKPDPGRKQFDQSLASESVRKGIRAAAGLRLEKCITALVRYGEDPAFAPYRESNTLVLASLQNGDLGPLKASVPQTSQETLDLLKANAANLARFKVVGVLKGPKDCFVFLAHPADPNNVLSLWFQSDRGLIGLRQANIINHVFSATYVRQMKEAVAKGLSK